jgi:hypothetical protein
MSAASLRQFQDAFAQALLAPDLRPGDYAPDIARVVEQPSFAVYRNTVMKGCIDALQANYLSVARLVGEEWFRAAAAIFVRAHLPAHPTLAFYGEGFADFLAGFEPAAELPYLPGVARLDRFWTEAHTAPDEVPIEVAAVARLRPESLARTVLRPHASARWSWFDAQPIATLWRRNRYPQDGDEAEIDWRAEGVLVVRPGGSVGNVDLEAAGCAFLDACAAGGTLAEAAAAALTVDAHADLAHLMSQLLEAGAFGRMDRLDQSPEER